MSETSTQVEAGVLPASYGDVASEYAAVREGGAGLVDLSTRARILVSGSEAMMFLNGLITNDVKALNEGEWMLAAFPNAQGRLLASARVLHRADGFLFDTESETREVVSKTLSRFTLAGDFHVTDLTDETALVSVQGGRASEIIGEVLGQEPAGVERGRIINAEWSGKALSVIRATHTAEDGFDGFVGAEQAAALWDALHQAGAQPVGFDALKILRVEAGLPRFGMDVDETNVVLEAGQDEAVSFTKGCYIGQEIIARIHWRGHVAKKLSGVMLDEAGAIRAGDVVRATDGKEIGRITSAVFSPRLKRTLALGLIKYAYLADGTQVIVVSDDVEHPARIAELPFVRGSWFARMHNEPELGS